MSESDVYRRHVLTSKVGPRVERVIVEKVVILEAVEFCVFWKDIMKTHIWSIYKTVFSLVYRYNKECTWI